MMTPPVLPRMTRVASEVIREDLIGLVFLPMTDFRSTRHSQTIAWAYTDMG